MEMIQNNLISKSVGHGQNRSKMNFFNGDIDDFRFFPRKKTILKVAGHCQNMSKMDLFKRV
jgi:hypothetical protein